MPEVPADMQDLQFLISCHFVTRNEDDVYKALKHFFFIINLCGVKVHSLQLIVYRNSNELRSLHIHFSNEKFVG